MSDFTSEDVDEELARALALSMENATAPEFKTSEDTLQDEDDLLRQCLQLSIDEANELSSMSLPEGKAIEEDSEEEIIARVTALSLMTPPPSSPLDKDDEELQRVMTLSAQEDQALQSNSNPYANSDPDLELAEVLALSRLEATQDSHQVKMDKMNRAAGSLSMGRLRQCIEVAKNTGGLIVGK